MAGAGFLYHPIFLEHDTGIGHPERPERLRAILSRLRTSHLLDQLTIIPPVPATRALVELAHAPEYVDQVEADMAAGRDVLSSDPGGRDTRLSPATLDAALMAAGAAVTAVQAVLDRQVTNAFACVRPPGHHATRHAGMGFCIFNNVAIAAEYARQHRGVGRVLIMDWDVHHGNGTQDIFEDNPDVFYISSHQAGIYPGTGSRDEVGVDRGRGTTLNLPLAPFTSEADFIAVWRHFLLPSMERFRPELVLISAGFDSHAEDLLGSLGVTTEGFGAMTRLALEVADEYAGGRLVSVLEGGYNVDALAESVEEHLRALLEAGSG